jgi:hypothetical protein
MAPVLNLHFYENENNVNPPELSEIKVLTLVNALLSEIFTALLAGILLTQAKKQLKLIPYSLSNFKQKS